MDLNPISVALAAIQLAAGATLVVHGSWFFVAEPEQPHRPGYKWRSTAARGVFEILFGLGFVCLAVGQLTHSVALAPTSLGLILLGLILGILKERRTTGSRPGTMNDGGRPEH